MVTSMGHVTPRAERESSPAKKISVNHVNLVKNSFRLALPYLTNGSSTKSGNWCDGKA